jgi:molybdopterin/thiamine biosynthesis adenylyltransferase
MIESSVSPRSTRFAARGVVPRAEGEASVTDRQEQLPGFLQEKLGSLRVLLIGAGGINGEVGLGLVRKGVGHLDIFDDDTVELSNLNRQRFFEEDLYKSKAECLARNLAREAVARCVTAGYPLRFQDAAESGLSVEGRVVAVCGVDNNEARVAVARHFLPAAPVVFIAVSDDAEHGYVFAQEPGRACYGCLFPEAVADDTYHPCSPAVADILKVVAGIALYAVDSLVMNRRRSWNYKEIFLAGDIPDRTTVVQRRRGCPICGDAASRGEAEAQSGDQEGA